MSAQDVHVVTDEQLLRVYGCGASAGAVRLLADGGVPEPVASQVGMSSAASMMIAIGVDPLARLEVLTHLQKHCQPTAPPEPKPEPVAAQPWSSAFLQRYLAVMGWVERKPSASRRHRLAAWAWSHRRILWAICFLVLAALCAWIPTPRGVLNGAGLLSLVFAALAFVLAIADPKRGDRS